MNTPTMKAPSGAGPVEKERRVTRAVVKPQQTDIEDIVNEQEWEQSAKAAQDSVAEPKNPFPMTIKLKRPILIKDAKTGDVRNELATLTFREPTALDIIQVGMPVVITDYDTMATTFDAPKMASMMARLAKVPVVYISGMDPVDWVNCATMLQRNFLPDWERMI
jgi:Phage tail assembly chaperone proteins, E, or 41 or 14